MVLRIQALMLGLVIGFPLTAQAQKDSPVPQTGLFSRLDAVYYDQTHCLTAADMRGEQDMRMSCWCRDAIVDARYVYFTYVRFGSKYDANMSGPVLGLEAHINQVCGEGVDKAVEVTERESWRWPGPEVVRTYPSDDVVARIKPEERGKTLWRGIPFTVQLVYRDGQGRITRTETYSSVEWEPVVK